MLCGYKKQLNSIHRSAHSLGNMIKKALLVVMAVVSTLVALEAALRIKAVRDDRKILSGALEGRIPTLLDRNTKLGDIVRLSRNPRIIYELRPDLSFLFVGVPVEINRMGFRGRDYAFKKERGTVRIVGLGDSVMFGWGVSNECTYLSLIEDRLNREHPGTRWEVINTAVPGYNTAIEVAVLQEKGLKYKPDLVLVNFVGNDMGLPGFVRPPQKYFSLSKSFLLSFLRTQYRYIRQKRKALDESASPPPHSLAALDFRDEYFEVPEEYQELVGWSAFERAMTTLQHLSHRHGFRVLVVYYGDTMPERVKNLCIRLGIDCLEPFPDYLYANQLPRYFDSPLCLDRKDPHPSTLGHEVGAEAIYTHLLTNGIIAALERSTGANDH